MVCQFSFNWPLCAIRPQCSGMAAYRYAIHIENWLLRFDRYIASEVSVSIKISTENYFRLVISWLSFHQNQHLASPNISTTAQKTFKWWRTWYKSRYNYIWKQIKTLYVAFTLYLLLSNFRFQHGHGHDHMAQPRSILDDKYPMNTAWASTWSETKHILNLPSWFAYTHQPG